jgi:hypothetical protein
MSTQLGQRGKIRREKHSWESLENRRSLAAKFVTTGGL